MTIFVPESAEFLHSKQKYEESRQVLTKVAHFNSVYYLKDEPYESYSFTQEVSSLDFHTQSIRRRAESDDSSDISDLVEANRMQLKEEFIQVQNDLIAQNSYWPNVARLTIMWIVSLFVFPLLVYQNKYLSGSIYINSYFDGITGLLAFLIGRPIYEHC